jgi:hypothetical protein
MRFNCGDTSRACFDPLFHRGYVFTSHKNNKLMQNAAKKKLRRQARDGGLLPRRQHRRLFAALCGSPH